MFWSKEVTSGKGKFGEDESHGYEGWPGVER